MPFIYNGFDHDNVGIYNVLDYGATGDGTTDDTAAIQAAWNAAMAATYGGVVYFPAGTYDVTGLNCTSTTSQFAKQIVLRGANSLTSRIVLNTTGVGIDTTGTVNLRVENLYIVSGDDAPTVGLLLARGSRLNNGNASGHSFSNMHVRGNFTQAAVASIAAEVASWHDCFFENVNAAGGVAFFLSAQATGIKLNGSAAYTSFTVASATETILASSNTGIAFFGCRFYGQGSYSLPLSIEQGAQAAFYGCFFTVFGDPNYATSLVLISAENTTDYFTGPTLFSGCLFEADTPTVGVELYASTTRDNIKSYRGLQITGCEFNLYEGAAQYSLTFTGANTKERVLYVSGYYGNARPLPDTDVIRLSYITGGQWSVPSGTILLNSAVLLARLEAANYIFELGSVACSWVNAVRANLSATAKPTSGTYHKDEIIINSDPDANERMGWVCVGTGGMAAAERANSTNYAVGTWISFASSPYSVWEVTGTTGAGNTAGSPPSQSGAIGATVTDGDLTLTKRDTQPGFLSPLGYVGPVNAITAAPTFVAGTGTAVNDDSTFDGYTLGDAIKALRNIGALT